MPVPFFYVIVNPVSGGGNGLRVWQEIQTELDARRIDYQVKVSQFSGHAVQLAQQIGNFAAESPAAILVIGGDGTLNQALTGVRSTIHPDMPLAYIPAGSGNDFARGIGLSPKPKEALAQILETSQPVNIDVGEFTETNHHQHGFFVNNIGIGFDAAIVSAANHSKAKNWLNKIHMGQLAYIINVIGVFFRQAAFPLTVTVDGKPTYISKAFLVTTSNHPYFGGGVKILPDAVPTDGKLDLIVVERPNLLYFLFLVLQVFLGRHTKYDAVHVFRSAHIQLSMNDIEDGQMDGEELGSRTYDMQFTTVPHPFWLSHLTHVPDQPSTH
ncbi:diacylglycerol/lipid kinase family protein [Lacticaseibacillus brantae]|uniref:DAGKc domain-containing protein n=1 Tax=Lacticaseibacillus brantae DSM 23927 TaxID=1423727 RepID=A0A0R2BAB2_9LACO|nr:diacylglycerol kinase family protein [Lacticaseibacillus brantae]KRM72531.1 hypothetical protein FC34_GL000238 [Lacticaseibacillus brantae DSM 23927]